MKLVWVGIALLVATIGLTVGCGPKEKYCYKEMDTCSHVAGADAQFMPDLDAVDDSSSGVCFNTAGQQVPCPDK